MTLVIRTLSDQLVSLMRDRILSGQAAPNSPLRQEALASELGISKVPLREALTRLEQEGLIHSQANRGFFVTDVSAAEAEEVYALRLKLEPEAMAVASQRAGPEAHRAAEKTLASLDEVTDAGGDGVGAFNRAFHLALLRPCGQAITIGILERLHILSERYVRKHLEPLGRDERAIEEHRAMLNSWLARDLGRVREVTAAHIANTLEDLRQQLRKEG